MSYYFVVEDAGDDYLLQNRRIYDLDISLVSWLSPVAACRMLYRAPVVSRSQLVTTISRATGNGLQVFFAHPLPTTKSFDCYHTQRLDHAAKVDADDLRHSVTDQFRMIVEMPKVFMNALLRFWR